uniref:Uncharacterized protein n=1 Tax=Sphaerodactylus townsendi TaxID=933632 RepID=A0ACB8FTZ9_9SAUR
MGCGEKGASAFFPNTCFLTENYLRKLLPPHRDTYMQCVRFSVQQRTVSWGHVWLRKLCVGEFSILALNQAPNNVFQNGTPHANLV